MNRILKQRLVVIILVFFLIVIVSGAMSFFVFRYNIQKQPKQIEDNYMEAAPRHGMLRFMKQQMNFTNEEFRHYQSLAKKNHENIYRLNIRIDSLGELIFYELAKEDPDSAVLEDLSKQFGNTHEMVNKQLISHVLSVKKSLNPEQQQKFTMLLHEMLKRPGFCKKNCKHKYHKSKQKGFMNNLSQPN